MELYWSLFQVGKVINFYKCFDEYNDILRSLREFGRLVNTKERYFSIDKLIDYDKRYIFNRLGYNFRMTDITASLGLVQLKKLDKLNKARIKNASLLERNKYLKI